MNATVEEITNIIAQLAEHEKLRVTMKESLKGGLITGLCTVAGGLLGGRTGLLLGGAIGTGLGVYAANDFKSVVTVIMYEMTDEQRAALASSMMSVLRRTAVPYSVYSILADEDIRSSAISLIRNAVQQMGYEMSA